MKHFLRWAYNTRPFLVAILLLSLAVNTVGIILKGGFTPMGIVSLAVWLVAVFFMLRCYHWDKITETNNVMRGKYKTGGS